MGKKIILWGTGFLGQMCFESLRLEMIHEVLIIDSDVEKCGATWNGHAIYSPDVINQLSLEEIEYIIICTKKANDIKKQIQRINYTGDIVDFLKDDLDKYNWISSQKRDNYVIERNDKEKRYYDRINSNKKYEKRNSPFIIKNFEECLITIIRNKVSLARFGDGEFEMIFQRSRPWFQDPNPKLAEMLEKVLKSDNERLIIAIPNQFASLENFTDEAAEHIRYYMSDKHEELEKVLDANKVYYDAYVSRPYILFKDKARAEKVFELWKNVWKDRNVVIIEGENIRNGIGNDLFRNATSIQRIICPSKNAFDIYDGIVDAVNNHVKKESLVLISLGPTATVLAYDLTALGYQAIDMGQIDNEYEWILAKAKTRISIKGKAVPELLENNVKEEVGVAEYQSQIICNLT